MARTARAVVYRRKRFGIPTREWGWRLIAANNKTIAIGGEGLKNKQDAIDIVTLIKSGYFAAAPTFVEGEEVRDGR